MENRKPASMKEFKERLGMRESSGNYQAKNKLGYLGKYQFGKMALQDAGYKDAKGNWTGKNGVKSEEDFLNNPEAQEKAMDEYTKLQRKYLKNYGADKYIGKEFKGVPVTESGLVAAAHLIGAKGLSKAIQKDEDAKDAFGTSASDYLKLFQNINLDEKEDNMNKLKKLESLREGIKLPMKKEEVADPATELGFENGGYKDVLSQMGLPELTNTPILDMGEAVPTPEETNPQVEETPVVDKKEQFVESPMDKSEEYESYKKGLAEGQNKPSGAETEGLTMDKLESEYRKLMEASKEERKTAQWATAATQIASMLDKFSARPVGIKPINFQAQVNPPEIKDLMNLGRMKGLGATGGDYSRDPNSEASKRARENAKELGLKIPDNFSEDDVVKTRSALLSTQRQEAREEGLTDRTDRRFKQKVFNIVDRYNTAKKDADKAIVAAQKAEKIIEEGGKMAPAVMGRLLARMSGEVGVMTDKDVEAFKGSSAWTDSMERLFQRGVTGTLTETDKAEMRNMVKNLKQVELNALGNYAKNMSKQYAGYGGVSEEELYKKMVPTSIEEAYGEKKNTSLQKPVSETKDSKTIVRKERSPSTGKIRITYSDGTSEVLDGE